MAIPPQPATPPAAVAASELAPTPGRAPSPAPPPPSPVTPPPVAGAVTPPPVAGAYPDPAKEYGGPSGPEPTRYGDWERKGIAVDF